MNKYYTLEEAAKILNVSAEEVFRMSCTNDDPDKFIFPAVHITEPLAVKRIKRIAGDTTLLEAIDEDISGYFELMDVPTMDDGNWTKPISCLYAKGEDRDYYQIPNGKSFERSHFRYSRAALEHFASSQRRDIQFPEDLDITQEQSVVANTKRPPQLDHKGKPRGIGKLLKEALQEYHKTKKMKCESLDTIVDMMKAHREEKQASFNHPYLKNLVAIGDNDKHFLCAKVPRSAEHPKGEKWYNRDQAQRNFTTQIKAIYPSE